MTKKDYIIIAKVIHEHYGNRLDHYHDSANNVALGDLVNHFANAFQRDNPRFDKQKFLIACGYNS